MKPKFTNVIIMVSKLFLKVLAIIFLTLDFAFASETGAQVKSVKEVKISLSVTDATLKDAFSEIEEKTDFSFNFSQSKVDLTQEISLFFTNETVEKILLKISASKNLEFKQVNNSIGVNLQKSKAVQKAILMSIADFAVSGQITDENGESLPGATVLEKGTSNGTITGIDGRFNFAASNENAILLVSFVGYQSMEVSLAGRSVIDIQMNLDVSALQEVIVVGYGTQKKSDLTGSVSSVKPEDIESMAVPTLDQALQGRAAGVFVSRSSGAPGAGAEIFIRGAGSIQGTDPLWIIDGVRTSPGSNFNMNDVESIEILKDASAAAIYGSAAANGVILVTTKRGGSGATKISFNSYAGITSALGLPDPLNTSQYAEIKNEAYDLSGDDRIPAYAEPNNLLSTSTDWLDVLYGNGNIQNYDLSVSGGNSNSNFFISGNYFKEKGTHVGTNFERYSIRANSDFKLGKRVAIGESIFISHSRQDPTNASNIEWIRATPALPVLNPDNIYGGYGTVDRLAYQYEGGNPLASELRTSELQKSYRVGGNVYFNLDIIKGLKLKTNLGANLNFDNDRKFVNTYLGGGGINSDIATLNQEFSENIRLLSNALLTYEKKLGDHSFGVLVGVESIKTDIEEYSAFGGDFSGNIQVLNGASPDTRNSTGREFSDGILSQFARVNYNYDDRYLFTLNMRRDGSSSFGNENQYGVFPSASVGWRIINESFMQSLSFLSDLKLRASYGILGNSSGLERYLFESSYTTAGTLYTFGDNQSVAQGVRIARFPNQEIKWEEIETFNIGIDLALLDGKLTFTTDYYVKNTNDLLLSVGIPPSAGFLQHAWYSNPLDKVTNIGQMQNKGLELALGYRDNITDNFSFNVSANASFNKNEVKALSEDELIVSGRWDGAGQVSRTEVGQPLGSFYGFVVDGIIQSQTEVDALNNGAPDGVYSFAGTGPGDFRYKDIGSFDENGDFIPVPDGEITDADRTYLGNPWPKWIYGINLGMKFKNFDLSVFFQGIQGVDRYNSFKSFTHNLFGDYNMTTEALGRWTAENPNNEHPRIIKGDPNNNRSRVSSYFVEDGSYLRLKNLQIGYTLPSNMIKGVSSLRLYISGQNLLTITNYGGFDPEFTRGGNAEKGIDRGGYPQSRIYTAGLQLDF